MEIQNKLHQKYLAVSVLLLPLFAPTITYAQVVSPDGTLSTRVNSIDNRNFSIDAFDNSNRLGNNLFHSFREFSIPTGGTVVFNNPTDIVNIINRVTGSNISNIDGLIKANGNANLFLINPNGIVFGANAKLDIGGSFVGSTASSIKFADGVEFTSINATTKPLLTVAVPVGLQFPQNPTGIQVQGTGHNYSYVYSRPVTGRRGTSELRVKPGNTLALVGGEITIKGGGLVGESGNIELAAIGSNLNKNPLVKISSINTKFGFDYTEIDKLAPINIIEKALLEVSGVNTGNIKLTGSKIDVADASWVFINNRGSQTGGDITVKASENLTIRGRDAKNTIESMMLNYTTGTGNTGNILVDTKNLFLQSSSDIFTYTFGRGKGGDVTINASDLIELKGIDVSEPSSDMVTSIAAVNGLGSGDTGKISISTNQLRILPGSQITTGTVGNAAGGDILINAKESIELLGTTQSSTGISTIFSATFGSKDAGDIEINTSKLQLQGGGIISAATYGSGQGGNIIVNASESINLTGTRFVTSSQQRLPSRIGASTLRPSPGTQRLFNLKEIPEGLSGSVTLNTSQLTVANGAEVAVVNEGKNDGGRINVNANRVVLFGNLNQSLPTQLSSKTNPVGKSGGDITLNLRDSLIMRQGSTINTASLNIGKGGDITINSPIIVGLENSDIVANAVDGNGGNVTITTQGIFGLEYRNQATPKSDITASSKFGVDGIVEINYAGANPNSHLSELPTEVANTSEQITTRCSSASGNNFVIAGRGGLPPEPTTNLIGQRTWQDLRNPNVSGNLGKNVTASASEDNPHISQPDIIVEATSWKIDAQGQLQLIAESGHSQYSQNIPNSCTKS